MTCWCCRPLVFRPDQRKLAAAAARLAVHEPRLELNPSRSELGIRETRDQHCDRLLADLRIRLSNRRQSRVEQVGPLEVVERD
jgi:hypothetical protein